MMKSYFKRIAAFSLFVAIAFSSHTGFAISNDRDVAQTVQKQSWRDAAIASLEAPLFSSVPYLKDVPFFGTPLDGWMLNKLWTIRIAGALAIWRTSSDRDATIRVDTLFTATDLAEKLLKAKNTQECVAAVGSASTGLCISLAVEGSKARYPFTQIRFIKWLADRCPTSISDISSHVVRSGSISAVAGKVLSVPYNMGYRFAQWQDQRSRK